MNHPSKKQFRLLAFCGVVLAVAGYLMDMFRFPHPTQYESDALDWNYWGTILPYSALITIWLLLSLSSLIGAIGFILFKPWSRWLLLVTMVFIGITTPLMGLYVARGLSEGIVMTGGLLFIFPFVLSFFPPCSGYYDTTANKRIESNRCPRSVRMINHNSNASPASEGAPDQPCLMLDDLKMKYVIPVIALVLGVVIGASVVSPLANKISSKFELSEEAHAYLEEMWRLYQDSPLTQEEYDEFVLQLREYGDHLISLHHHEVLWVALYASAFIGISENQGIEAANEFARQQLERFKIQYEKGINLGSSQIAAEKLYSQITAAESESESGCDDN